ncbi:MAG: phenylalanine--tRNA ligase subunit alpha [Candidatus Eisenbacteria bacterium]|nr:phenylalanine--tRNA ligase subunit alpha [Candidatus Eisenbacteria bacterium]
MRLPDDQIRLLAHLGEAGDGKRVAELGEDLALDQARVAAAAVQLAEIGLLRIAEEAYRELVIRPEGRRWIQGGIPERRLLAAVVEAGGTLAISDAPGRTGMEPKEIGGCLRWFQSRGWGKKDGPILQSLARDPAATADERLLDELLRREKATAEDLERAGVDLAGALELLKGRPQWCEVREKAHRRLHLTAEGRKLLSAGIERASEVNQLTPELIASGRWREATIRPYDVNLPTEPVFPGKRHPLQRVLDETRRVFLEMGFQEIVSPIVESSFWNFDALFQPQDHPAREMQDTFFLDRPGNVPLPEDRTLVDRVRRTHEDGGETGSIGWQYRWDEKKAARAVLRTHTTATTARALAADPIGPRRVFCVGRVFRRETIDYKHLPVFYQVDGIVVDREASFATLLGTLSAFYRKMGFGQFQFRPAFFPYTEPSVEVYIWFEKRKDWVEMGGAGIFRPEVTEPLGCKSPVLAWGLGLERIAMMRYDLSDMRDLYLPDTEWLKGVPLCL